MKVALLAHLHHRIAEPFLGGTEMHTALVANELVRRGHQVTLFAKEGSRTLARLEPILAADFVYGRAPDATGADQSYEIVTAAAREAIGQIVRDGYDIVFNNSLGPLPYTELPDHPMITVLHTPPTLERVLAVIENPSWSPGRRHGYVSVSEVNAAAWRTYLPSTRCIPNGIYLDQWRDCGGALADLAVWSARITPEKGLPLAIEAARKAGMRLEFGGPIADQGYFETEVKPLLGEDVVHHGHLDHVELATLLSRGRVFLASALWAEPFGLSMVEAMACGTPVAAFPMGAAAEVVNAGGGFVAANCTSPALADAILLARELDRTGVRASVRRYDAGVMMDAYEALMDQLIA